MILIVVRPDRYSKTMELLHYVGHVPELSGIDFNYQAEALGFRKYKMFVTVFRIRGLAQKNLDVLFYRMGKELNILKWIEAKVYGKALAAYRYETNSIRCRLEYSNLDAFSSQFVQNARAQMSIVK